MIAQLSRRLVLRLLARFREGRLDLTLPDGERRMIGQADAGPRADLHIRDENFFRDIVLYGEIGFGEGYMEGQWETSDLTGLLTWFLQNIEHVPGMAKTRRRFSAVNLLRVLNRLEHVLRPNSKRGSRRNIAAHYDLSNEFFRLFLDPTLTYSCAYFTTPEQDLSDAQQEKYRRLCEKLGLRHGERVLEIGCGWGGFALFAAQTYGVHVTGITVSQEQAKLARQRVREAGLEDLIEIRLEDYRDVEGTYDKIVSIEMLEAVGHAYLPVYFQHVHRLLKEDGALGLQVIVSPDARYDKGRKGVDWIQKHIFPGGQLPSPAALNAAINRTGELYLHHLEAFGLHYARTLRRWRDLFNQRLDDVRNLGFDETFIRKWNFYLSYCEAGFAMRNINLLQLVYVRPNATSFALPGERFKTLPL